MKKVLNIGILNINTNHPKYSSLEKTLSILGNAKYSDLDLIIGPEWGLMNNALNQEMPYSYVEFGRLLSVIRRMSTYSNALIVPGTAVIYTKGYKMYNILPVFYKGKTVFSTIKKTNGGTSFFDKGRFELIGEDYSINNTFVWDGLKIGIEICADSGMLYKQGKTDLDLQILSSSGIRTTELAVKKSGYLICSDGHPLSGRRLYIVRSRNAPSEGRINLENYRGLFNFGPGYRSEEKLPFEFVDPEEKHRNLNVYRIPLQA